MPACRGHGLLSRRSGRKGQPHPTHLALLPEAAAQGPPASGRGHGQAPLCLPSRHYHLGPLPRGPSSRSMLRAGWPGLETERQASPHLSCDHSHPQALSSPHSLGRPCWQEARLLHPPSVPDAHTRPAAMNPNGEQGWLPPGSQPLPLMLPPRPAVHLGSGFGRKKRHPTPNSKAKRRAGPREGTMMSRCARRVRARK